MRGRHWDWLYNASVVLSFVCGITLGVFAAVHFVVQKRFPLGPLESPVLWCSQWTATVVGVSAVLYFVCRRLAAIIGRPWLWHAVENMLCQYRTLAFKNMQGDPFHFHRVTLFQRKRSCWLRSLCRFRWPWSGWLVPVAGTSRIKRPPFLARENEFEGIAGKAWYDRVTVEEKTLPDVAHDDVNEELVAEYAKTARINSKQVRHSLKRKEMKLPLEVVAFPIEVDGRVWGVLLLESCEKDGIKKSSQDMYPLVAGVLGQLAKGGL